MAAYHPPTHLRGLAADIVSAVLSNALGGVDASGFCVLDVGCGSGMASQALAPSVLSITGVDNSCSAVDAYNAAAEERGLQNCRARIADATDSTALAAALAPSDFRLAFSHMSLHHVADATSVLRSLAALTSPGGTVTVSDITRTPRSLLFHKSGAHLCVAHMGGFEVEALAQQMREVGLVDVVILPQAAFIEREVDPTMNALLPRWVREGQALFHKLDEEAAAAAAATANGQDVAGAGSAGGGAAAPVLGTERHAIFLVYGTKP